MRGALAIPLLALLTLLLGGPAVIAGLLDPTGRLPHDVVRVWGRLFLRIVGIRVELEGLGHIPRGPAVFAANHSSALDIPIMFGYLPVRFRIIHKRSLILIPVIGWFLFVSGHIAIDRRGGFRAKRSLESAARRIRGGTSLVVFPEGTRSADGRVGPFKRGSFILALKAAVPVIPVSLIGVKRLIPNGVLSLRKGTVRLEILPALSVFGRGPEDAAALAAEVREAVATACAGSSP
ncbi:MAG TPA: lysophospholipid acyltransferase family protein [Vicinamibacteria bacterium]|jgi:1-acyl-sn-glycerol-3-phosphate acyltransferase|nr:lysophospholipid acyltransferase family protein [Vicinamibacteria bacterium]